jgi:hypothetical protein
MIDAFSQGNICNHVATKGSKLELVRRHRVYWSRAGVELPEITRVDKHASFIVVGNTRSALPLNRRRLHIANGSAIPLWNCRGTGILSRNIISYVDESKIENETPERIYDPLSIQVGCGLNIIHYLGRTPARRDYDGIDREHRKKG